MTNVAAVLTTLNSDVILLQGVRDRVLCGQLAGLLRPVQYDVAICSPFADPAVRGAGLFAILSSRPIADTFAVPWKVEGLILPAGGFAFAAMRHGDGFVFFINAWLQENRTETNFERDTQLNIFKRELSAAQIVQNISVLESKQTNHQPSIILAGTFNTNPDNPLFVSENTLRVLEQSGFLNAFSGLPLKSRITCHGDGIHPGATLDYLFAKRAAFSSVPKIVSTKFSSHFPVTCELTFPSPGGSGSLPALRPAVPWRLVALVAAAAVILAGWLVLKRKGGSSCISELQTNMDDEDGSEGEVAEEQRPEAAVPSPQNKPPGAPPTRTQSPEH